MELKFDGFAKTKGLGLTGLLITLGTLGTLNFPREAICI